MSQAKALSAEISCFTRAQSETPNSSGCSYWPLVKRVTIEVPKRKGILENVILMDLPGTGDYNKSRDEMWKQVRHSLFSYEQDVGLYSVYSIGKWF